MIAKAGLIDHISPGRLQLSYIAKQQILNSGFKCSILFGQLWSSPLVFPKDLETPLKSELVDHFIDKFNNYEGYSSADQAIINLFQKFPVLQLNIDNAQETADQSIVNKVSIGS